ncbi:MAG TPA: hypothetical protein GXZ50_11840 [Clostridia bacterium]|jgi:FtsZ-binding cell division protein ZapB|nr:hypothetical protein [Clostridia bacterium]
MAIQLDNITIDTISILFRDVNELLEVMNSLTNNYRLLVGAAEELTRIPGVTQQSINYALDRADNTGTLIDLIIFTLAVKLDFVSEVLNETSLPLDLVIALFVKAFQTSDNSTVPRDPNNLLPRPDNPFSSDSNKCLSTAQLLRNQKWKRRYQRWENKKKKWAAKRKRAGE